MKTKLTAKNLITVGLFTAIYFVLFFATGMLGYIPILMVALPLLCPLITGIPFMLFLTKVKTFGMVTIMGTLLGILMFVSGHSWTVFVLGVLCGVVADSILQAGKYKGWKTTLIGYAVFSEWIVGAVLPMFTMRETYFAQLRTGYGEAYADALMTLTPNWALYAMILLVVVGAVAGAYLGRAVLKKHFVKAGIAE